MKAGVMNHLKTVSVVFAECVLVFITNRATWTINDGVPLAMFQW